METQEQFTEKMNVRVTPALKARIEAIASEKGIAASTLVRVFVIEALRREGAAVEGRSA